MRKFILIAGISFLSLCTFSQNWDSLRGGIEYNNQVRVLYADTLDNYLYVAGGFYQVDGKFMKGIARWDGFQWDSLGAGMDGLDTANYLPNGTLAITRYNGELYVGGVFNSAGNVWAEKLAKWNGLTWDTLSIKPFRSGSNGSVSTINVINNKLYIGGTFDTIAGMPCKAFAEWNGASWNLIGMPPNMTNTSDVISICEYNGEIYLGGNFNSTAFPNDSIMDILKYDGSNWKSVGGGMKGSMAGVWSMAVYNGELYVAGYFLVSDGNVGNYIQKWNGTSWSDVGGGMAGINNNPSDNAQIFDLQVHNGKLYAAGVFQYAGGAPAQYVAVWDGVQWCGLGSAFDNTLHAIGFYKDTLYIGGGFWKVDGDSINHIAKWTGGSYVDSCGNTSAINENNISNELTIYPNPSTGKFKLQLSGNWQKGEVQISNVTGSIIYKSYISKSESEINISNFSEGIYLIKINCGSQLYFAKIVIQRS